MPRTPWCYVRQWFVLHAHLRYDAATTFRRRPRCRRADDLALVAHAAALLPGDADGNGTVNGADLNIVLSNYNQSSMDWGPRRLRRQRHGRRRRTSTRCCRTTTRATASARPCRAVDPLVGRRGLVDCWPGLGGKEVEEWNTLWMFCRPKSALPFSTFRVYVGGTLVVITIIAILMRCCAGGADGAGGGAADAMHQHLKQIGVAFQNHHSQHGFFPTGGWGCYWVGDPERGFGRKQTGGWSYTMLPFMEQDAVYRMPRQQRQRGDAGANGRREENADDAAGRDDLPLAAPVTDLSVRVQRSAHLLQRRPASMAARTDYAANAGTRTFTIGDYVGRVPQTRGPGDPGACPRRLAHFPWFNPSRFFSTASAISGAR